MNVIHTVFQHGTAVVGGRGTEARADESDDQQLHYSRNEDKADCVEFSIRDEGYPGQGRSRESRAIIPSTPSGWFLNVIDGLMPTSLERQCR